MGQGLDARHKGHVKLLGIGFDFLQLFSRIGSTEITKVWLPLNLVGVFHVELEGRVTHESQDFNHLLGRSHIQHRIAGTVCHVG